jgi:hypothetical protein
LNQASTAGELIDPEDAKNVKENRFGDLFRKSEADGH